MDVQSFILFETCFALNKTDLPKFIMFTNFCVVVYVPWWITSPVASQTPINDLNFMQQLFNYSDVDESCASTALKAFSRNFWYLTGELIPQKNKLTLFSNKLTTNRKEEIA